VVAVGSPTTPVPVLLVPTFNLNAAVPLFAVIAAPVPKPEETVGAVNDVDKTPVDEEMLVPDNPPVELTAPPDQTLLNRVRNAPVPPLAVGVVGLQSVQYPQELFPATGSVAKDELKFRTTSLVLPVVS